MWLSARFPFVKQQTRSVSPKGNFFYIQQILFGLTEPNPLFAFVDFSFINIGLFQITLSLLSPLLFTTAATSFPTHNHCNWLPPSFLVSFGFKHPANHTGLPQDNLTLLPPTPVYLLTHNGWNFLLCFKIIIISTIIAVSFITSNHHHDHRFCYHYHSLSRRCHQRSPDGDHRLGRWGCSDHQMCRWTHQMHRLKTIAKSNT